MSSSLKKQNLNFGQKCRVELEAGRRECSHKRRKIHSIYRAPTMCQAVLALGIQRGTKQSSWSFKYAKLRDGRVLGLSGCRD